MARLIRSSWSWLRWSWEFEPVLVVSVAMGAIGNFFFEVYLFCNIDGCRHFVCHGAGPLFVYFSPGTQKAWNEAYNWPTSYKCKIGCYWSKFGFEEHSYPLCCAHTFWCSGNEEVGGGGCKEIANRCHVWYTFSGITAARCMLQFTAVLKWCIQELVERLWIFAHQLAKTTVFNPFLSSLKKVFLASPWDWTPRKEF